VAKSSEMLLTGGRFVDPAKGPKAIGTGLLARDGKIAFVGPDVQAKALASRAAERIDLAGGTAIPGLVDAHVHLKSLGEMPSRCDLAGTASREEALARLAAFAEERPRDACIRGRGYNLNQWDDPSYPTARQLDRAVPDRPCVVNSFDGHSAWANSAALAATGLDSRTADPPGGRIVRNSAGRPTGCVLEAAISLLDEAVPKPTDAEIDRALRSGVREMVSLGYTGVHVPLMGGGISATEVVDRLDRLYPGNTCPLRVRVFAAFEELGRVASVAAASDRSARVQLAGIKVFLDGALGSRTAWMSEPYRGSKDDCGMAVIDVPRLRRQIEAANKAHLPLICHAIGDRACHEALLAFARAGDRAVGNRIEHAQILRPEDIDLFAEAGVAASVQPAHIWTDWAASDRLLGSRRAGWSFPLRSLLAGGAVLAIGSDAPVVPADPRHSLHAAVSRTDAAGNPKGGWNVREAISPDQWAAASSWGAWRSIGQGARRGRLAAGMDCDLTVFREDFLAEGFSDYLGLHVEAVFVAGRPTLPARS